jgi:hypothetical protein
MSSGQLRSYLTHPQTDNPAKHWTNSIRHKHWIQKCFTCCNDNDWSCDTIEEVIWGPFLVGCIGGVLSRPKNRRSHFLKQGLEQTWCRILGLWGPGTFISSIIDQVRHDALSPPPPPPPACIAMKKHQSCGGQSSRFKLFLNQLKSRTAELLWSCGRPSSFGLHSFWMFWN